MRVDNSLFSLLFSLFKTYEVTLKGLHLQAGAESLMLDGSVKRENGILTLLLEGQELNLRAKIPANDWTMAKGEAHAEKLPTVFLARFAPRCGVTLPELIGKSLDFDAKMDGGNLTLNASSSQLNGAVSASFSGGVTFSEDSRFIYHMDPVLANRLKESGGFPYITKPLQITFEKAEQLSASFKTDLLGWGPTLQADQVRGRITPLSQGEGYAFLLKGNLGKGTFELTGNSNPFQGTADATLVAKGVSTAALPVSGWIGPALDLNLNATLAQGTLSGSIALQGNRILLPKAQFVYAKQTLEFQDPFTVKLTPSLQQWNLSDSDFVLKVDRLSWKHPEECFTTFHWNTIAFDGALSSKQVNFAEGSLTNLLITLSAERLDRPSVELIGRIEKLNTPLLGEALYDEPLKLDVKGLFDLNAPEFINQLQARVEGDHLFSALDFVKMEEDVAEFNGQLTLRLTEELLEKFHGVKEPALTLKNRAIAQLLIDRLSLNLKIPQQSSAKGRLLIDELAVGAADAARPASLRKVSATWSVKKEHVTFAGEGITSNAAFANQGKVKVVLDIDQFLTEGKPVISRWVTDGELLLENVPSTLLGVFFPEYPVEEMLGPSVTASVVVTSPKEAFPGKVSLAANSDNMHVSGNFLVAEGFVKQQGDPILIDWKVTPATFAAFHCLTGNKSSGLQLTSPGKLSVQLSDFLLPLDAMLSMELSARAGLENLEVQSKKSGDTMMISAFNGALRLEKEQSAAFKLECKGYLEKTPSEGFVCELGGKVSGFGEGLAGLSIDVTGNAQYAPPVLLGELICLPDEVIVQVDSLVGKRVNAQVNAQLRQLNGPLQLKVEGTDGNFSLDAQLASGVMTLKQPFVMQLNISPDLSDSILDELVPFLDSAVTSERPIRFEISPEGFSWRIYGDLKQDLYIEKMTLDLGQIFFKNDQTIAEMLSILKFRTERDLINVWFTPLYASLQEGVFRVQRMDMLVAERYPMAIWGKVDFPKDQVRMTVGLGGLTLKRAFGLKGVPNDYYLQVALKGTTDDAHLDVRGAATKLAAFIAQLRGGPQGIIMGGILDLIGGGLGQKKTPKPTTYPFPWEVEKRGINYQ
ncbi:MAG: hypothetical protein KDK48_01375 [Chlamydiia bacterium]|nr:hypothetical protein [Chlamydiia bacterium]